MQDNLVFSTKAIVQTIQVYGIQVVLCSFLVVHIILDVTLFSTHFLGLLIILNVVFWCKRGVKCFEM